MCDENTGQKLIGYSIRTLKNGAIYINQNSHDGSTYSIAMPLGFVYDVEFSLTGYLSKIIRVDARNIPEKFRTSIFELEVNGTLFPEREGFNTRILDEPMAKASINVKTGDIEFNEAYYKERQKLVENDFARLDDLKKNAALRKKEFDDLVKDGDDRMTEASFVNAATKYSEALAIFPLEAEVRVKYNLAMLKVAELHDKSINESQYMILMARGDSLMKGKFLVDAQNTFLEAKKKKDSIEVKEKLYEVDQALEKRSEYEAFVSTGDKNFDAQNFTMCIQNYNDALALFPEESYPDIQIAKANKALEYSTALIETLVPTIDIAETVDTTSLEPIQKVVFVVTSTPEKVPGIIRKEYPSGNKMITEYIIQKGRYQESYRMVEAKNATYYFRNNTSMTESLWNQAIASFEE